MIVTADPTSHADAALAVMDRLIEAGAGTEYGIAEYLAARGVTGTRDDCALCVLAIYISGELEATPWAVDGIGVYPSGMYPALGFVGFSWAGTSQFGEVDLPPVLNWLASDFDDKRYPELEAA